MKRKFAYRAYLDGLRGISVAVVVLFHTNIAKFRQGFLGVDVFFVLSGYLITSILLREIDSSSSIDLFRFYARRARRILPGAAITLLIVAILEIILGAPSDVLEHGKCMQAASIYFANICFINVEEDYWATETQNPINHFWSLSIEEQFYFFYPFTLLVIVLLSKKFGKSLEWQGTTDNVTLKKTIMGVLIVAVVVSFGFCWYLILYKSITESHMNSFGRVYQLASGGILSIFLDLRLGSRIRSISRSFWTYVSLIQLVAIVFLMMIPFKLSIDYPAVLGMIMCILTLVFIFSLETENQIVENNSSFRSDGKKNSSSSNISKEDVAVSRKILGFPGFVYLGKWSYSIYLWHFPLIVLGDEIEVLPEVVGYGLMSNLYRLIIIVSFSLVLGLISYYVIEKPFMKIPMNTRRRKGVLAMMGIIIPMITFIVITELLILPQNRMDLFDENIASSNLGDDNSTFSNENFNASEYLNEINIVPGEEFWYATRVAVYGDSHAIAAKKMWMKLSKTIGFKIQFHLGVGMPPFDLPVTGNRPPVHWKALKNMPDTLIKFKPDLFVIHNWAMIHLCWYNWNCPEKFEEDQDYFLYREVIYEHFTNFFNNKVDPSEVKRIVFFLPTPENVKPNLIGHINTKRCCERNIGEYEKCDFKVGHQITYPYVMSALEEVAEESENDFKLISLDEFFCPNRTCPANDRGKFTYVDHDHIYDDYWIFRRHDFVRMLYENNVILSKEKPSSNSTDEIVPPLPVTEQDNVTEKQENVSTEKQENA